MAETTNKNAAIRKRQKIQQSNKTMFAWIAMMSAVVGICLVVSWFLYQQLAFKTEVVSAKKDTVVTLENNVENADELVANVRKHETDKGLNAVKANKDDRALQVILDALPANNNPYALGGSIQKRLTSGLSGVDVESLTVGSEGEVIDGEGNVAPFRLIVTSREVGKLRELLLQFERSIRTISVQEAALERPSNNQYSLTIDAEAYYEPMTTIDLGEETIKP